MEAGGLPPRWGAYARRLAERDLALSVQVLQEFYVQATRARRPDAIGHQQAVLLIESFQRFPVQDITSGIMMAALDTRQRFQLSYWDAAIIEASRAAMAACKSCPKTWTTARTIAASGSPIRSAEIAEQPVSLSFARRAALPSSVTPAWVIRWQLIGVIVAGRI
jgi:hypothetical protein